MCLQVATVRPQIDPTSSRSGEHVAVERRLMTEIRWFRRADVGRAARSCRPCSADHCCRVRQCWRFVWCNLLRGARVADGRRVA